MVNFFGKRVIDFRSDTKAFTIEFPYEQDMVDTIKFKLHTTPTWNAAAKLWEMSDCVEARESAELLVKHRYFSLTPAAEAQINLDDDLVEDHGTFFPKGEVVNATFEQPLYAHQEAAVKFIKNNPRVLLADDVGVGKTRIALASIEETEAYPCVIVCPAVVKNHWRNEAKAIIPHRKVHIATGRSSVSDPITGDTDIIIINYEILAYAPKVKGSKAPVFERVTQMLNLGAKGIIMDEAHYCKKTSTKRYKACMAISKVCKTVIGATGTPMPNGDIRELASVLGVCRAIDKVGGYHRLTTRHGLFYDNGFGLTSRGIKHPEELKLKLNRNAQVRRLRYEVRDDMPTTQRTLLQVEGKGNKGGIKDAENELIDFFEEADMSDNTSFMDGLALLTKLRKEAGLHKVHDAVAWAEPILESGRSVVLFTHHVEVAEKIQTALFKHKVTFVTGQWCAADGRRCSRDDAKAAFEEGKTKVFVATIGAAGTGMDGLQKQSADCCFVELPWTPDEITQAEGRLARSGQKEPFVSTTLLILNKSVDEEAMMPVLSRKDQAIDSVLKSNAGKAGVLHRIYAAFKTR